MSALADAMAQVLTDETLRAELRRKARLRGIQFTWEDTSSHTLAVLRRGAIARGLSGVPTFATARENER